LHFERNSSFARACFPREIDAAYGLRSVLSMRTQQVIERYAIGPAIDVTHEVVLEVTT